MNRTFELGHVSDTDSVYEARRRSHLFNWEVLEACHKYIHCDWGDDTQPALCALNDIHVTNGDEEIRANYNTSKGNIFIITERDRSETTVMFADEYVEWATNKYCL